MANRYWVGGSGTWASTGTTNWSTSSGGASGASAPTTSDAVIFDANSNTGTNDFTVTLGTNPACQTLNTTGIDPATAMTVDGSGSLTVGGLTFTLTNKVVWAHTGTLTFAASIGSPTNITTAGVTLNCNVVVAPTGNLSYNFVDNFTTTGTLTLSRGTLNTTSNNKTLTVAAFLTTSANTKSISLGASSVVNITGNNATVLDLATGTSITWVSPSLINLTYAGSTGTRTLTTSSILNSRTVAVTGGSDTVTLTASNALLGLDFTGFSGTWTNVALSLGNLTVSSGMTVGAGAGVVTFNQTGTVTTNGNTLTIPLTVNGSGITTTLGDNVTLGTASTFTLTQGTLALGANTLSTGIFSSTGALTPTITRTSGGITVTGNNATVLTMTGNPNLYGAVPVTLNYSGSTGTRSFSVLNQNVLINITAGTDTVSFTGASSNFGALDFTGFTGTWANGSTATIRGLTLTSGMTVGSGGNALSLAGSFTLNSLGKTFDFPVTISSSGTSITLGDDLTLGSSRLFTLTQGTLALGANNLSAGLFSSTGTSTRSVTRTTGNITLTGNGATVLALTGSGATYGAGLLFNCNYAGSTGTRTFNVTNTGPEIDITAGSDIVTFTTSNTPGNLDFTGFSGSWSNVTLSLASLTVSTGMTVTAGANTVTFARTGTIISNGKTLDFPVNVNGAGITTTIGDALTIGATRTLLLNLGTLSNAGNYNVTLGAFASANSNTRTLALGSGTWTVSGSGTAWNCSISTNLTVTGTGTLKFTNAATKTFSGGGLTWPVLDSAGTGQLTVGQGNTFTTITNSVSPTAFRFSTVAPNTVTNFNVSGTAGNLVTIDSTTAGTQATISKASGTVSVSYCSIQDSNATGGATWYASTTSGNVDAGNNTGWLFSVIGDSTILEAATGTDAVSAAFVFAGNATDSATGTDAVLAVVIFAGSATDSATGTDAVDATLTYTSSVDETATGTDAVNTQASLGAQVSETGTGTDAVNALRTMFPSASETAAGTDTANAQASFGSTAAESATGTDVVAGANAYLTNIAESATGTDAVAGRASFGSSVDETGTGTDAVSTTVTYPASIAETATGTDAALTALFFVAAVFETATGTDNVLGRLYWELIDDSQNANWAVINDSQTPGWTLIDDNQTPNWQNINTQ